MDKHKLLGIGIIAGAVTTIGSAIGYVLTKDNVTYLPKVDEDDDFDGENDEDLINEAEDILGDEA